jgi:hypothetical protein
MTDMRATERLLQVICEAAGELSQEVTKDLRSRVAVIESAATELQGRGDTLVRHEDLRLIAAAANHGRQYGPEGDTDYTGFESALERIESALGGG